MPWSPLPAPHGRSGDAPTPLSDLLDQVLAGLGAPSVEAIVVIHERWAEVVGAEVVAHATPIAVEDGRLRVAVDSSAWASHLRWSEAEVLARLGALVGPGVVTALHPRVRRS